LDHLADVIEGFVDRIGLHQLVMCPFDFGAPAGSGRHPPPRIDRRPRRSERQRLRGRPVAGRFTLDREAAEIAPLIADFIDGAWPRPDRA
jgi:hypothetical protein